MLMSEVVDKAAPETSNSEAAATPSVEVYAVYGVEPEIRLTPWPSTRARRSP